MECCICFTKINKKQSTQCDFCTNHVCKNCISNVNSMGCTFVKCTCDRCKRITCIECVVYCRECLIKDKKAKQLCPICADEEEYICFSSKRKIWHVCNKEHI